MSTTDPTPPLAQIAVRPDPCSVETGTLGQHLNCDFVVQNLSDQPLTITAIELSVHDRQGAFVLRRFINHQGFAPSILTVPNRELAPSETTLVLNPFALFDPAAELGELTFSFTCETDDAECDVAVAVLPTMYQAKAELRLPLAGRSLVYDGHDFYAHHRRFNYLHPAVQPYVSGNFMRYAHDFCPVDADGATYHGDPDDNASWLGFGEPVLTPAAGTVVGLLADMLDDRSFNPADLETEPMRLFGNHVVIDHGDGEWSMCGHLQAESVTLALDDSVAVGQQIGRIGASGSANIPHLHYELRDGLGLRAEGLPATFAGFRRTLGSHAVAVERGAVDTGDVVEPLA